MSQPSHRLTHPLDVLQVIEPTTAHDLQHGGCDRQCDNCPCRQADAEQTHPTEQEGMTDAA